MDASGDAVPDWQQIVETQIRYGEACDARDWVLLRSVFTDDATGDYGATGAEGAEALVGMIRGHLEHCGPSQHLLGNHVVRVDGETATARCAVQAFHAGRPGSPVESGTYVVRGSYHDDLVRTAQGWRIRSRRMVVSHQSGDPAVLFG